MSGRPAGDLNLQQSSLGVGASEFPLDVSSCDFKTPSDCFGGRLSSRTWPGSYKRGRPISRAYCSSCPTITRPKPTGAYGSRLASLTPTPVIDSGRDWPPISIGVKSGQFASRTASANCRTSVVRLAQTCKIVLLVSCCPELTGQTVPGRSYSFAICMRRQELHRQPTSANRRFLATFRLPACRPKAVSPTALAKVQTHSSQPKILWAESGGMDSNMPDCSCSSVVESPCPGDCFASQGVASLRSSSRTSAYAPGIVVGTFAKNTNYQVPRTQYRFVAFL